MHGHLKAYLLTISLLLGLTLTSPAASQTFTTLDYPGAAGTIATGINDAGTVIGDFCPAPCNGNERNHGYTWNQGTFAQFVFPGAVFTRPLGINRAGQIVGYYRKTANNQDHGFLLSGGTFTTIDFPGATQTHAIGIDRAGNIFGGYCKGGNACYAPGNNVHGFVLSDGIFATIDVPGAMYTDVWNQDSAGQIVGRYQDASGLFHIFLLSSGTFKTIDFPNAAETAPGWYTLTGGINADGEIASIYCTAEPCGNLSSSVHGFLLSGGAFTAIDFPGAVVTAAAGVNSLRNVAGWYFDGNTFHGYLRTP